MVEPDRREVFDQCREQLAESLDAEVFVYSGPLVTPYDDEVITHVHENQRNLRPNLALILSTYGGSPDAAYRIARSFQNRFENIILLVDGPCMSAGTLVAVGASEIVLTNHGILSPLDVQVRKPDEIGEMSSGLTMDQAMFSLQAQAFSLFESNLLELKLRSGGQITLKTAMEIAAKLTTGLLEPIYAQIDPVRLGEDSRMMKIAEQYGDRLNARAQNLKEHALARLLTAYPSHGFVIDFKEARELFLRVRQPREAEIRFLELVPARRPSTDGPRFAFLSHAEEAHDVAIQRYRHAVRDPEKRSGEDSPSDADEAGGSLSSFPDRKASSNPKGD